MIMYDGWTNSVQKLHFIKWLNWSTLKRSILIDSLSIPNFAIQIAKVDSPWINFSELLLQFIGQMNIAGAFLPSR